MFDRFWESVRGFLAGVHEASLYKASAQVEYEATEMDHLFTLLLFGNLAGWPAPPAPITMELLPLMEEEVTGMLGRASTTGNALSELASVMGEP